MNRNIKELYKDKIIEEVNEYKDNYYYFYKNKNSKEIFGISKKITFNEYSLLKEMYIEKKVYSLDKKIQNVYDYLFEEGEYPFKNKKIRMIIYLLKEEDENIVADLFSSVYKTCYILKIYNLLVCFYEENTTKASSLLETLSIDLNYDILIHDCFYLNDKITGELILEYIDVYRDSMAANHRIYSDFSEIILSMDMRKHYSLISDLKAKIFEPYFSNASIREIVNVMFKNDLNVSMTSKMLYMNRNSLINKIENIYKDTGLNLQTFSHACFIYFIINML